MAVSASDIAFVQELFADMEDVTCRRMMGGLAVYSSGRIFALHAFGRIHLKAAGALAEALAAEGATQFEGIRNGRAVRMPYWTLPDAALDDPGAAAEWARRALAAAYGFS